MIKTPIVIINGFLGSGKTTLLRNLLVQSKKKKISVCVIVNDMSKLDVDGELIANTEIVERDHNFESIYSCILSSKNGIKKLDKAITNMLANNHPDLIIIETSGSCHPLPLVEYFKSKPNLNLTGVLTLVDSLMITQDYDYGKQLIPLLQKNLQNKKRNTTNLLCEQIMFCSHLILTKSDKIEGDKLLNIAQAIHPLNPYVSVISMTWGNLSIDKVLTMSTYNYHRIEKLTKELNPVLESEPINEYPYNLATKVIKDYRPFHPERLWDVCHQHLNNKIYRSKGFFWLPNRDKISLLWNQTSGNINLELVGYWRSGIIENNENGLSDLEIKLLKEKLSNEETGNFGDRHCHLTIIGDKTQIDLFTKSLTSCFLTEEEINFWKLGGKFTDPWPKNMIKIKS